MPRDGQGGAEPAARHRVPVRGVTPEGVNQKRTTRTLRPARGVPVPRCATVPSRLARGMAWSSSRCQYSRSSSQRPSGPNRKISAPERVAVPWSLRRIAHHSTEVCAPSVMGRPKVRLMPVSEPGGLAPVGTDSIPAAKGLAERVRPVDRAGEKQLSDGIVVAVFPGAAVSLDPVMHRWHIGLLPVLVGRPGAVRTASTPRSRPCRYASDGLRRGVTLRHCESRCVRRLWYVSRPR